MIASFAGVVERDELDTPEQVVSVVIPCLNEAGSIVRCVVAARGAVERAGIVGEVIVVDNGSTDGSAELAESAGARVVRE